jgi:hypothetical protein
MPTHSHFLPSSIHHVSNLKTGAKIDNRKNRDKKTSSLLSSNNKPQQAYIILNGTQK